MLSEWSLEHYEEYVAENNNNDIMYEYLDDKITLHLRWMHEEPSKSPYSLFVSVEPKDDKIENIFIDSIEISSSKDIEYQFTSPEPLLIYNINKEGKHLEYHEEDI